jgi:hypothetical protein
LPPRRLYPPAGYRLDQLDLPTVDMAGHFLALRSATSLRGLLQVFDWRTGREVYRVPPSELSNDFSFALQRDGKVVVTQRDNSAPSEPTNCEFHTPLTWYSPAEPHAHALSYRPCGPDLRMARGRIVYRGPGRLGSMLWMTDLRGRPPLRLSGTPWVLGFIEDLHPPFDFDGRRIAYGEPGCVDERVVRETVAAIARRGYLHGMTCPARFAGRDPISERHNGKLTAKIACTSGCTGSWEVDSLGRHPETLVDGGNFRVPADATRVLTSAESALPRYQSRRERRRRQVRVVVTVEQPSGSIKTIARTVTILTTRDAGARSGRRLRLMAAEHQ